MSKVARGKQKWEEEEDTLERDVEERLDGGDGKQTRKRPVVIEEGEGEGK